MPLLVAKLTGQGTEVFSGVGKFWAVTNPLDGQLLGYHNQTLRIIKGIKRKSNKDKK